MEQPKENWYHVVSYAKEPHCCYGFAALNGVVNKANEKIIWAIGRKVDDVLNFFEGKPAIVTQILTNG